MANQEWDYSGTVPQRINQPSINVPQQGFKTPGGATITQQDVQDVGYKAATGVMGAPVDLVNMFLQPLGLGSETPVMGSDWMNQQATQAGLISSPEVGGVDIAASLVVPDPFDIVQFTKYGSAMLAGAMIPGRAGGGVDDILAQAQGLEGKQLNKFLNENIDMRSLNPEDKQKVIDFRKGNVVSKPKATKEAPQILAREFSTATRGVYSKLEDEIAKIPDDMRFETREEAIDYLQKKGVTKAEIEGSKLFDNLDRYSSTYIKNYNLEDAASYRPDKLEKKSIFDQTETTMRFEDWESEWVSTSQTDRTSVGESGVGWRVYDERLGREQDIGLSYDYERYVDENGYEIGDYEDMRNDWFDNYAGLGDYQDEVRELAEADGLVYEELSDDELKDYIIAAANDDDPWYDFYGNKEVYETEYSGTYDTLEEAEEATKQSMYEEYSEFSDEGESFEGYTVDGGENYDMDIYRMPDYKTQPGKYEHEEPHLKDMANWQEDYENVAFHARRKDRTDADGKDGRVLEELQSQWEQDWRSEGGDLTEEQLAAIPKELEGLKTKKETLDEQRKVLLKEQDELKKAQFRMEDAVVTEGREFTPGETTEIKQIIRDVKRLNDELGDLDLQRTETGTKIRNLEKKSNPTTSAPPIAKRTQYEKVALMDQLKGALDDDKDYFGFINGHVQNGSFHATEKGMIQAYDVEMPRIIQKLTGEKPYMASFDNGKPISGEKVFWDAKKAAEGDYYQKQAGDKNLWYWRIDLTPELKDRLSKSKTQLYTHPAAAVGAGALAGAAMYEGEEE